MDFLGTNNQNTIIFGYSPNNEINFLNICADANSNLLWNGNILYKINDNRPQYTNGIYICYWSDPFWIVDIINTQNEVTIESNAYYPWQAGIGSKSCPNGDCGDYGVGAITLDGRTLYYIGDRSYTDGEYIVYYDSINQQWAYETIGVGGISYVSSLLPYPWLAGLGQKDCAADFYNAVIVSDTAEVNGTYTLRGVYNYRPYYNLVGSPDSPDAEAMTFLGNWCITDINTDVMYTSYGTSIYPWQSTWDSVNGISAFATLTPTFV